MTNETSSIPIQVYSCPLVSEPTYLPCAVKTCMYHETSSLRGCRYAKVHEAFQTVQLTRDVKKNLVCKTFSMEEEDLAVAIRRVLNVLQVNEFFTYLFSKSVMDARPKELEEAAKSESKYEAWRPSSKKIPFSEVIATLEFLKHNLT